MKKILLWAVLAVLVCGCAMKVSMTGYMDPSLAGSVPLPGATFCVLENLQAPNPIFDREIKGKIEVLLANRGYRIAPQDRADNLLGFSYDLTPGLRIGTMTTYEPPQTQVVSVSDGKGGRTYSTVTTPGAATVTPTFTQTFTRQLTLKVMDGASVRSGQGEKVLWIGETLNTDISSDLRHDIDYLLAAAFSHFLQDTGKQVDVRIGGENPDMGSLMRGRQIPAAKP